MTATGSVRHAGTSAFAKAGEPVTTEDGKITCYVKNDLLLGMPIMAEDFGDFSEGEEPWMPNQAVDPRRLRQIGQFGMKICINGEWRP